MKTAFLLLILMVFVFPAAYGQEDTTIQSSDADTDRIKSAVDGFVNSHKLKVGIFRIRPSITFGGGFDSNALYSDDTTAISDVFLSVIPRASVGFKLSDRAFFDLTEAVDFLYYRKLSQRRDIFNTTGAKFVTGTRNVLFAVDANHLRRKAPVNEEVDVPVENEFTNAGIRVEYSATSRIDVLHQVRFVRAKFIQTEEFPDTFPDLKDSRGFFVNNGMAYEYRENIQLTGDFRLGQSKSLDSGNTTTFWNLLGGIGIQGRPLSYNIRLGYGQFDTTQGSKRGTFLMVADVNLTSIHAFNLGASVTRLQQISYFLDEGARTTTSAGVRTSIPLIKSVSLQASYTIGKNDYGDNLVGGQIINKDNFYHGLVGLSYRFFGKLTVHGGIQYLKRDTDIPDLNKTRRAIFIGLGGGYSLGF